MCVVSTVHNVYTQHNTGHISRCVTYIHTADLIVIPSLDLDIILKKQTITSTTPSCSGQIPAQKPRANSVPGDIFSHLMFEMNFYHFHRFSWEKIH